MPRPIPLIISRSWPRRYLATSQPLFTSPTICSFGTSTSSKKVSQKGDEPLISRIGLVETPGVAMSKRRKLIPPCLDSVEVRTRQKIQSALSAEGVDILRRQGGLDLLPGAHLDRVQAGRDQLPPLRHGHAGRLDQTDPADQRFVALLRDLLRRCGGAKGTDRRRSEQGMGRRQISPRPRTRDDQRN